MRVEPANHVRLGVLQHTHGQRLPTLAMTLSSSRVDGMGAGRGRGVWDMPPNGTCTTVTVPSTMTSSMSTAESNDPTDDACACHRAACADAMSVVITVADDARELHEARR